MKEDRANSKNSKLTVEWNSKNSAKEELKSWRSSQYRRFLESEAKTSLPVTSHDIEEVMWIVERVKLSDLHARATWEQVLLALTVFILESRLPYTIQFERYSILKKYRVDVRLYATVLRNLLRVYRLNMPIQSSLSR